jgi:transcriptional regulator with XRE-family HTH domain
VSTPTGRQQTTESPLRAVREAQGFGLRELAIKVGVDHAHLSKVERGLKAPSLHLLVRLAEELGLDQMAAYLRPYLGTDRER